MAAPIRPAAIKAFQAEKYLIAATIADPTKPSLAELQSATSLDVSCTFFDDFDRLTQNTNLVTLDRRVCDGAQYQQVGVTNFTGGSFWYQLDVQAAAGSNGKKTYERLPEGTSGFLIRRLGMPVQTDFATGQFVDVIPFTVGPPMPTKHGDGETAEVAIMQTWAPTGPPSFVKALVA